jgi:hypothetical protein
MPKLRCLVVALVAACTAACQSTMPPPGPSYSWSVTNEMLGELQITATRRQSAETVVVHGIYPDIRQETRALDGYAVTVRGIWPERNVRNGDALRTARSATVYWYNDSRNEILDVVRGSWPPNEPFEFSTIVPAEMMEDAESGVVAICMGPCFPASIMDTSDTNVPWLAAAQ